MNREYHKAYSQALKRDMEMLIFGDRGAAVIFFPPRTARFYDYENWKVVEAIKDKIEGGLLQVFCVDSVDLESFYAPIHPSRKISRHAQYEEYILNEVIPYVQHKNRAGYITAAGCSLGGYHAINIAFRHPEHFSKVVGMSARYDLTLSADTFPDLFSGHIDDNIYYHMPSMYMPRLTDETILQDIRKLDITIVIGKDDPFYANNKHLSDTLTLKNVFHQFYIWNEEAHRPRYWRRMVQLYL